VTSDVLDLVSLALFDHGPMTLNDLALMTCLPLPSIRMHLQLNRDVRYRPTLTIEGGIPIRRWALIQFTEEFE
jgi:hypothetical protein